MRWKALAEIYKMHSFAPFWNRIPKTRKTVGRKEPGPDHHGKKLPGEAHEQPQLLCTVFGIHRSRGIRLGEEIYENKH